MRSLDGTVMRSLGTNSTRLPSGTAVPFLPTGKTSRRLREHGADSGSSAVTQPTRFQYDCGYGVDDPRNERMKRDRETEDRESMKAGPETEQRALRG